MKTGDKAGRWTVIGKTPHLVPRPGNGNIKYWLCRCKCGVERLVLESGLKNGSSASCGKCTHARRTHGMSKTPEFRIWDGMRRRAGIKPGYEHVKVCRRWQKSFANFYEDMGPRPSAEHSLDRYPNNNGPYAPANCRWATPSEQQRNRRDTRKIAGESIWSAAERAGINPYTVFSRIRAGWPKSDWLKPVGYAPHG